jgi:hypothetical protein
MRPTRVPHAGGPPDPRKFVAAAAAPLPGVTCDGIEVVQVVQSLPAHDVVLVAQKTTVVRVYLSTDAPTPVTVRGTLSGRPAGGAWQAVPSNNTVTLVPAEAGQLRLKRESLDKGLYFVLPAETTAAGTWDFQLTGLEQSSPVAALPVPANAARSVTFLQTPPLRVRVLGIRFSPDPTGPLQLEPRPLDFTLLRSWLGRAYPVSAVEFSTTVVDFSQSWPFDPNPDDAADHVNAYVRTIRTSDVAQGTDPRTHYYGMVYEGTTGDYFMRGKASVPSTPDPSAVGSGPTGGTRWTNWDTDGSYGDWYAGHEIGHTFGRTHANFCGAGGGDPFPYPNGQISPDDGSHVGLDVGDPANNIPLRALPGVVWHDLMSYCDFQWLSGFTYQGIRDRLAAEDGSNDTSAPPPAATLTEAAMPNSVHVVARVNLKKGTAAIASVLPHPGLPPTAAPATASSSITVRVADAAGQALGEFDAPFIPNVCEDPGHDRTGMIDVLLPAYPAAAAVEVRLGGKPVAEFRRQAPPAPIQALAVAAPPAAAAVAHGGNPVITWTHGAQPSAPAAAPGGAGPVYLVLVSTDGGRSWRTIAANVKAPAVVLDRSLLAGADEAQVRVVATDGFATESATKSFRVADL